MFTEEQIDEGNKLISEYMEADYKIDSKTYCLTYVYGYVYYFHVGNMLHQAKWNWIMPVYCKINNFLQFHSTYEPILSKEADELQYNIWNAFEDENCCPAFLFEEIVKFIKWHNSFDYNKYTLKIKK